MWEMQQPGSHALRQIDARYNADADFVVPTAAVAGPQRAVCLEQQWTTQRSLVGAVEAFFSQRPAPSSTQWTHWMWWPEQLQAALLGAEGEALYVLLASAPAPLLGEEALPMVLHEHTQVQASPLAVDLRWPTGAQARAAAATALPSMVDAAVAALRPQLRCAGDLDDTVALLLWDGEVGGTLLFPGLVLCRRAVARMVPGLARDVGAASGGASAVFHGELGSTEMYGCPPRFGRSPQLLAAAMRLRDRALVAVDPSAPGAASDALDDLLHGWQTPVGAVGTHTVDRARAGSARAALRLMCSRNPLGRPCLRLRDQTAAATFGLEAMAAIACGDTAFGAPLDAPDRPVAHDYRSEEGARADAEQTLRAAQFVLDCLPGDMASGPTLWAVGNALCSATLRSQEGFAMFAQWHRAHNRGATAISDKELGDRWHRFVWSANGLGDLIYWLRIGDPAKYQEYVLLRVTDLNRGDAPAAADGQTAAAADPRPAALSDVVDGTQYGIARLLVEMVRDVAVCVGNHSSASGGAKGSGGRSKWYLYKPSAHRWVEDAGGTQLRALVSEKLTGFLRRHRGLVEEEEVAAAAVAAAMGGGGGGRGRGRGGGQAPQTVSSALRAVAHNPGEQSQVVGMMESFLLRPKFPDQLDLVRHLLPFTNGVLDMHQLRVIPGRPEHFCSKGPNYEWRDWEAGQREVAELERMLGSMQPYRCVRDLLMSVCGSLLVKGQPHKQMYILFGDTNGGKSFIDRVIKTAMGDAYTTLSPSVLASDDDASGHTEWLMPLRGASVAGTAEPDANTRWNASRIKRMVTPFDGFSGRGIFGTMTVVEILAKLMAGMNAKPPFTLTDRALFERLCLIEFPSFFTQEANVPKSTAERLRLGVFPAQTRFEDGEMRRIAQVFVCAMFHNFVDRQQYRPDFSIRMPLMMELARQNYLRTVTSLRRLMDCCLRPVDPVTRCFVSPADDEAARVLGRIMDELAPLWGAWEARSGAPSPDAACGSPQWAKAVHEAWRSKATSNRAQAPPGPLVVALPHVLSAFPLMRPDAATAAPQDEGNQQHRGDAQGQRERRVTSRASGEVHRIDPVLAKSVFAEETRRSLFGDAAFGVAMLGCPDELAYANDTPSARRLHEAILRCAQEIEAKTKYPVMHPASLSVDDVQEMQFKISAEELGPVPVAPDAAPAPARVLPLSDAVAYMPPDTAFAQGVEAALRRQGFGAHVPEFMGVVHRPFEFTAAVMLAVRAEPERALAYINPAFRGATLERVRKHSWVADVDSADKANKLRAIVDLAYKSAADQERQANRSSRYEFGFLNIGTHKALPQFAPGASRAARRLGITSPPTAEDGAAADPVAEHADRLARPLPPHERAAQKTLTTESLRFYGDREAAAVHTAAGSALGPDAVLGAAGLVPEDVRAACAAICPGAKRPLEPSGGDDEIRLTPKRARPNAAADGTELEELLRSIDYDNDGTPTQPCKYSAGMEASGTTA